MGRATPLGPWETRDWPSWERPKKSFTEIALGTSVKCDVRGTLRVAAGCTSVFGNGEQRHESRGVAAASRVAVGFDDRRGVGTNHRETCPLSRVDFIRDVLILRGVLVRAL